MAVFSSCKYSPVERRPSDRIVPPLTLPPLISPSVVIPLSLTARIHWLSVMVKPPPFGCNQRFDVISPLNFAVLPFASLMLVILLLFISMFVCIRFKSGLPGTL
ncbi:Uncharacterised protein [Shigella sonnei]|nr:Uncharacterised protein [Shigella sonnei]